MENLLIDIGNSDVKIGTGKPSSDNVKLIKRFSYSKELFEPGIRRNFPDSLRGIKHAGVSLLKDFNKQFIDNFISESFSVQPVFIDRKMKLPFKIAYEKTIGNDRICNAAATVVEYKRRSTLIIDFGTATTYTFVQNKVLIGGLIAPGVKTSLQSLIKNTTLPEVDLKFPKKMINRKTAANIQAGVLYQVLYSAERVISELKKKYKDLFVIATGGFSQLISSRSKMINVVDRKLLLKGINYIISQ